jgi:hypothetical protein
MALDSTVQVTGPYQPGCDDKEDPGHLVGAPLCIWYGP